MAATLDISKLPKWAQSHIEDLTRERDSAKRELAESLDNQTPSAFYEEFVGEQHKERRYIQTINLVCEWRGVRLRISAHDYGNNGCGIGLQWECLSRSVREVAFIPSSCQAARLVAKEDME